MIGNYILIGIILLAIFQIMLEVMNIFIMRKRRTRIKIKSDFWIWGIFYFNPDDPRIFVPKEVEWLGWTLNFAQPISIIITGGILVSIIISLFYKFSK
ncbi:MAG: DUF5808 domain-containing protein [Ignavibacteriaceae bacterium]